MFTYCSWLCGCVLRALCILTLRGNPIRHFTVSLFTEGNGNRRLRETNQLASDVTASKGWGRDLNGGYSGPRSHMLHCCTPCPSKESFPGHRVENGLETGRLSPWGGHHRRAGARQVFRGESQGHVGLGSEAEVKGQGSRKTQKVQERNSEALM